VRRIVDDVGRWPCVLHRTARGLPLSHDADGAGLRFADELFGTLYSAENERLPEAVQDPRWRSWALALHDAARGLPTFVQLARDCEGDADAAAVAVETLLEQLSPQLEASHQDPAGLRKAIRLGATRAASAVDELRDAVLGLEHVALGGGTAAPLPIGVGDGDRARVVGLARRLRDDAGLRKVAVMAGRFRRILEGKRRTRVQNGVDEVNDVTLGGDIARMLPSTLVALRHPKLRLLTLASILERKMLVYESHGRERQGRGPLVVLVDRSSSMKEGDKDAWALATTLALLALAKQEGRVFAVLGFSEVVGHEVVVGLKDKLPEEVLRWPARGGTNISLAVGRALELIEQRGSLSLADVVVISDGEADSTEAPALMERAQRLEVSSLGLAIDVPKAALAPWCHHTEAVGRLDTLDDAVANAIRMGGP
jgi:Mg-chelatase subunit ChlD